MTHEVFKARLAEIHKNQDPEIDHPNADDFLVEVLEDMGFDLTVYKESVRWYA